MLNKDFATGAPRLATATLQIPGPTAPSARQRP